MQQKNGIAVKHKSLRKIANTDDSAEISVNLQGGLLKNIPAGWNSILAR